MAWAARASRPAAHPRWVDAPVLDQGPMAPQGFGARSGPAVMTRAGCGWRLRRFPSAGTERPPPAFGPWSEVVIVTAKRERTISLWMKTEVAPDTHALQRDETADVVVVGAGMTGLSTAYELSCREKDVVVIDRGPIGGGMTARTTAHLASDCDDSFAAFIKVRGLEQAKLFHQSHAAGIDRIERIQPEERIACNFRRVDGFLFRAVGRDPAELDDELAAARRVGMKVGQVRGLPFKGQDGVRCLRYPNQAAFHPLKYLRGLAAALRGRKARIYANSIVETVEDEDGGVTVRTVDG